MGPGEYVNYVSGTFDNLGVTSLCFKTNSETYGPYGNPSGTAFSIPLQQGNSQVVAFFGRSSDCLVAIGTYVAARNTFGG